MKTKVKQLRKADTAAFTSAANRQLMAAILSPLEAEVMKRGAHPFTFHYNQIPVYISGAACGQIIRNINYKMQVMNRLLEEEHRFGDLPARQREQLDDTTIVLSLHPVLRNRLCKAECYTLSRIIAKGRAYFANELGLSKTTMKTLDALFAKHNCLHLFS